MSSFSSGNESKIKVVFVLPHEFFNPKYIHCRDWKDCLLPTFQRQFDCYVCSYGSDLKNEIDCQMVDLIFFVPPIEAIKQISFQVPDFSDFPDTPIVGLLIGDKYSPLKLSFYQILKKIGAVACFNSCEAPGEIIYIEEALPLYHLNMGLFVNESVFRDYNEKKMIPVGFFGAGFEVESNCFHYRWRQQMFKKLAGKCPFFCAPRLSDIDTIIATHDIVLGKYARMLNSCYTAFTCGSHQNKILAKHLEIPACRCCLVTEDMPMLREYGFFDMINCVTVDEKNVIEKISSLFSDKRELERITVAGFEHVKNLIHTDSQYNTIYEWFKLYQQLSSDEKIVQTGVFSFEIIKKDQKQEKCIRFGPDLLDQKCLEGYRAIKENDLRLAARLFHEALNVVSYCGEAITGLGMVFLFSMQIPDAERCFMRNIKHVVSLGGVWQHDPVDIACLVVCKLCQNNVSGAKRLIDSNFESKHPAINAARFMVSGLNEEFCDEVITPSRCPIVLGVDQWYAIFSSVLKMNKG